MVVQQSGLCSLVLHTLVHTVQGVENHVVLGLLLVHLLQLVDEANRVCMGLQIATKGIQLVGDSLGLLVGVFLGHFQIAVAALKLLCIVGIAAGKEGNLSNELSLGGVVLRSKEG